MKKYVLPVLCFLMFTVGVHARTVITTYENPEITTDDVIECFIEELNKPRYAYALYDYEVYNTRGKQDNAWSVEVSDCSYEKGYQTVRGEQVIIHISNGYFTLKTFGGETQESTIANGFREAANLNDIDESNKFYNNLIDDLKQFALKSHKWQKKYNKEAIKSKDTVKLCFIDYTWFFGFSSTRFIYYYDDFYYKTTPEDLKIDVTNFESKDISDSFIKTVMEMSGWEYPIERTYLSIDYFGDVPKEYSKVLEHVEYKRIYNTDQKEYSYIELDIANNDEEYATIQTIYIEMDKILYEDSIVDDETIEQIASNLDEYTYYEGIFATHNEEVLEDKK